MRRIVYAGVFLTLMTAFYFAVRWAVVTIRDDFGIVIMAIAVLVWWASCYLLARQMDKRGYGDY